MITYNVCGDQLFVIQLKVIFLMWPYEQVIGITKCEWVINKSTNTCIHSLLWHYLLRPYILITIQLWFLMISRPWQTQPHRDQDCTFWQVQLIQTKRERSIALIKHDKEIRNRWRWRVNTLETHLELTLLSFLPIYVHHSKANWPKGIL